MQPDEAGRRVDPEFVGQELADALEGASASACRPFPVQREHQLLPEPLPQRMPRQQRFELRDRTRRRPRREQRSDSLLLRLQPELVQPSRLGEQRAIGDVGERRPTP